MIPLVLGRDPSSVLCIGAHADDIEIGAAATIARFADRYPDCGFTFVILSSDDERRLEAERSATSLLGDRVQVHVGSFRDGYLPYDDPAGVKDYLKAMAAAESAEVVLAPNRDDLHQDHSFLARLTDRIYRDHLVLGYEIPKYDGDLGRPQVYVPLSREEAEAKVEHLRARFLSQHAKPWFSAETFMALMRLRGVETGAAGGYAEAFHVGKSLLS